MVLESVVVVCSEAPSGCRMSRAFVNPRESRSSASAAFSQFCATRQRSPLRSRTVALRLGRVTVP